MKNWRRVRTAAALGVFALTIAVSGVASAHCDTLDGPVVADARTALQQGDVTPVLKWVTKENEAEVRQAFARVLKVRAGGRDARELADLYFFETLVRVHRAGEGAPYTGLKPAGTVEPIVALLDQAIGKGAIEAVSDKVAAAVQAGIRQRFLKVLETKKHLNDSVAAGRVYVAAYVTFMHYVEGLHKAVHAAGHHATSGQEAEHAHE